MVPIYNNKFLFWNVWLLRRGAIYDVPLFGLGSLSGWLLAFILPKSIKCIRFGWSNDNLGSEEWAATKQVSHEYGIFRGLDVLLRTERVKLLPELAAFSIGNSQTINFAGWEDRSVFLLPRMAPFSKGPPFWLNHDNYHYYSNFSSTKEIYLFFKTLVFAA